MFGSAVGIVAAAPFFWALNAGMLPLIYLTALIIVNVCHDMIVSVQQPLFTEMFGTNHRYSGAGVGYQIASVFGGGFTPLIASGITTAAGGSWVPAAGYLMLASLISLVTAWRLPRTHDQRVTATESSGPDRVPAGTASEL